MREVTLMHTSGSSNRLSVSLNGFPKQPQVILGCSDRNEATAYWQPKLER